MTLVVRLCLLSIMIPALTLGATGLYALGLATVNITDSSVAEGDVGTVNMVFTVTRSGDMTSELTVGYALIDGTAISGTDYTGGTGTVFIPSGAASATIGVPVIGNTIPQLNRSFTLQLTGIVNTVGPSTTFAGQQVFATGNSPVGVAVGDLNGDGKLDLAVVNGNGNTVSILLNTTAPGAATPNFAAQQTFATGSSPFAVSMGDFNGDGRLDLAVVNLSSNSLSILLNTTVPGASVASFAPQQTFATGSVPVALAIGDINGDGRLDLVVANQNSNTVSVLLNTTALGSAITTFAVQQTFATGSAPRGVALGDFNGDGKLDLAVANFGSNTVSVLLNATAPGATTASFSAKHDFATDLAPIAVALGDLNGDGLLDIAVANNGSDTISVFLSSTAAGATTPSFAAKQDFATGSAPNSVAAADFNGDGKLDLVAANNSSNTVSMLVNATAPGATTPTFHAQQILATGSGPGAVVAAHFNGGGMLDLAVANTGGNTVSVLLNTTVTGAAPPGFAAKQDFATGTEPTAVAMGNLNGDGRLDFAVANQSSNTVSILLNTTAPGAVTQAFASQQTFATGSAPVGVALGDVNGDGRLDLVVVNFGSNTVSVLLNTTTPGAAVPSFAVQQTFATGLSPRSVALGDFNGDGRLDLAVTNLGSNSVSILLNTTAPGATTASFAAQQTFATGSVPVAISLGDFNGDGRLDLVVANQSGSSVSVLFNTTAPGSTTPSFAIQQTFAAGPVPVSIALGDFNGDGLLDLAVSNAFDNTVSMLLNTTAPGAITPSFAPQQTFATGILPVVASGDFNGDGRPDLAITNSGSANVSVRLNTTAPGATTVSLAATQNFATGTSPGAGVLGDLNHDGTLDIAVANQGSATVSVLLNLAAANANATGTIIDDDGAVTFQGAASRKVHGAAGTFNLSLSPLTTNPTTEPRQGPAQTIVFTFDRPIASAAATITEGIATAGTPTVNGNDVIVGLTGVNDQQYLTVSLANVVPSGGGSSGSASVRVGFLVGDVNQNRVVSLADLAFVNAQLAQPVTAANFLKDVNANGSLSLADKGITNANLAKALPAP